MFDPFVLLGSFGVFLNIDFCCLSGQGGRVEAYFIITHAKTQEYRVSFSLAFDVFLALLFLIFSSLLQLV